MKGYTKKSLKREKQSSFKQGARAICNNDSNGVLKNMVVEIKTGLKRRNSKRKWVIDVIRPDGVVRTIQTKYLDHID